MSSVLKLLARVLRKAARVVDPPKQTQLIQDEYLTWLSYANPGMLERGNPFLIDYAIQHLPSDAPILEIGSFCGLSTNVITHLKRKRAAKNVLITCDKWQFENVDGRTEIPGSPVKFADYSTFVRESYIRNVKMFSPDDLPFTVELLSDEFFAAWREKKVYNDVLGRFLRLGGPLSFCYIDGNHTYDCAKRDFVHCDEFLEIGGFLLFDDSTLAEFTLHRLMPEIISEGRYKLVATNPYHLFQKVSCRTG